MPSPFPGIDPFIESQRWADFHTRFITLLSETLMPRLRPKYIVDVEQRVYVERDPDDPVMAFRPDVAVVDSGLGEGLLAAPSTALVQPVECVLPLPEEAREAYLTIRRKDLRTIVTVIELLSPANKRPGANGFDQYLDKRDQILLSASHLVELDLLRGGRRMPLVGKLPPGDFLVTIARVPNRPRAAAYVWSMEQRLPTIPIPLAEGDPDVPVDLQQVFDQVYDRGGYDYALDYGQPPEPPLPADRTEWVQRILESRGLPVTRPSTVR